MAEVASIERALRRDRAVVAVLLAAVTAASWAVTAYLAAPMGAGHGAHAAHHLAAHGVGWVFAMWAVMMAGMMIPTAAPFVVRHADAYLREGVPSPIATAAALLAGYLAVWTVFSLVATLLQWGLESAGLIGAEVASNSPVFSASVLLAAGLFQFTPAKTACIHRCRSAWPPRGNAFLAGVAHGTSCAGSCALLMLVLFVTGAMSLPAMAALTALVLLEKVAPGGVWIARAAGVALCGWGAWVLLARV